MLDPEFEPEFYDAQIKAMEKRYALIFEKWDINWNNYYSYIRERLKYRQYWIWVYLCGFEKFLQEEGWVSQNREEKLYKDAEKRLYRIIGDSFKIEDYINSL